MDKWDKLKDWIKDYQDNIKIQEESVEGLDLFEKYTLIILDNIAVVMKELEENNV